VARWKMAVQAREEGVARREAKERWWTGGTTARLGGGVWGLGRNTGGETIQREEGGGPTYRTDFGSKPFRIQATHAMTVGVGHNTVVTDAPHKAIFL
jgi:hypothetical protein